MNKRFWIHMPVGVLNAAVYALNPLIGLGATVGFLGYEYIQEWRKNDNSHKDVIGWLWWLYVGVVILGVIVCFTNISV